MHIRSKIESERKKQIVYWLGISLLILLFIQTGLGKLGNLSFFAMQLGKQPLPQWSKPMLLYALPILELSVVLLLLFAHSRRLGLFIATILMGSYTLYAFLAYIELWGSMPCACGKIFNKLNWGQHALLNFGISLLAGYALYHGEKKRNTKQ